MRPILLASAPAVALAACGGAVTTRVNLGQPVTVQANTLQAVSDIPLKGDVVVTFAGVESSNGIQDKVCGTGTMVPKDRWVIVYYSVKNELNTQIQPSTQVAPDLLLVDSKGRSWSNDDYGSHCFLSANAAEAHGDTGPESMIGAGLDGKTAIVFDVPTDATGLAVDWKPANVHVDLGQVN
jgi:hypothetical protein